jgi:membrane-associated phospholipid phosphatase
LKKRWIAAYVFAACLLLTILSYFFWDIPITKYCRTLSRSVIDIAEIITTLGITTWYLIASAVLYLFFRFIYKNKLQSMRSLFIFCSLSICGILIILIKWVAGRYRPVNLFNNDLFGFDYFGVGYELTSFPSGHAQTIFTLATALTLIFPRWGIPLFIVAAAVSISRIVLTSHYLSDVIAGAGIGILFTLAIKYYFDQRKIELTRK